MPKSLEIICTIDELRTKIASWRKDKLSIGLVPTMGALHGGHLSLVARSVADNDRTCVTIFVNPRQFGPGEDFKAYPRDHQADTQALEDCKADLLFAPSVEEMYPTGSATSVSVVGIGDILEGEFRPDFFKGVATVVTKLLFQIPPNRVYFGEKDYQQLCLIERMKSDLDIPVEIIGCPTIRERDGLALSSRNIYLNKEQRSVAPGLHRILIETAEHYHTSNNSNQAISKGKMALIESGFTKVDYIAICDPATLNQAEQNTGSVRVLGAAWLGRTRLIDNVEL